MSYNTTTTSNIKKVVCDVDVCMLHARIYDADELRATETMTLNLTLTLSDDKPEY